MSTRELSPSLPRERPWLPIPAVFADAVAIAWRGLITYRRVPQLLVFSTIQPVVFVLMFRYVFGGAIRVPGVDYVDYLMPGIFIQTSVFGAIGTAIGLASDVQSGLLERFLSLPMARSAVLMGRTLADLGRNVFVILLMSGVGFLVGYHLYTHAIDFVAAMLLVPPVVSDALAIAWRGVITYRRVPQLLVFSTIQPVVFVLLFGTSSGARSTFPASTTSTT